METNKKNKQIIKRNSDKKWLISAEEDTWTDNKKQATAMNLNQQITAEATLLKKYKFSDFDVFDAE